MAEKSVHYTKGNDGKTYRTETTRYDNGASKSVTTTPGFIPGSSKHVSSRETSRKK